VEGLSTQTYTFGSIIKPQGDVPKLVERSHVSIAIAAIKCFATDDPGGVDEPYLITTIYGLDPSRPEDLAHTQRIDNSEFGDIGTGDIFAKSRQIANDIVVPGDGEIRIHVQLWDEEVVGSTEGLRDATNATAQAAITAAMSYFGGPVGAGGAILTAASGLLSTIGGAIGDFVGNFWEELFGDDLIDQHEFVIPSSFLRALTTGDPSALNRTSESIPEITYNFPDTIEDDSWLLDRGSGTYRIFFKITNVE
jgi:hypothetical protein